MADAAPERADDLLGDIQARREGLRAAMGQVEAAASEPAPTRESEWRAGLAQALTRLRTAFDTHLSATEGEGGVFEQVIEAAPRLAKRVERLHGEHETIAAALSKLDVHLTGETDVEETREAVLQLLGGLARHRHRGADLLHEAFVVDVSVGD